MKWDLFVITKCIYNHACLTFFPNLKVILNLTVFQGRKYLKGCERTIWYFWSFEFEFEFDHFKERCLKLLQNNMVFLSDEFILQNNMDVRAQDHFKERCLKLLQNNMVFLSDELICIWTSFSKLESFIGCSLKSFPSYLKLDNLVVIIHDVIYIFRL